MKAGSFLCILGLSAALIAVFLPAALYIAAGLFLAAFVIFAVEVITDEKERI